MPRTGRPKKTIDQKAFENLCGLQCTESEICEFFDVTDKTLNAWCRRTYRMTFSEVFKKKREKGKVSLRRRQYEVAQAGNVSMLIWLGKQWLDQTEKPAAPEPEKDTELSEEIEDLLSEYE